VILEIVKNKINSIYIKTKEKKIEIKEIMKIEEFKNYLKLTIGSQNTRVQYLSRIKMFFGQYGQFSQVTINGFLAQCVDKNLKPHTFNGYMNALKHYGHFAKLELEYPKQKKANKTKKGYLTLEELEKEILPYFQHIFQKDIELKKLVVRLLFSSGMRPCELLNLKKSDLDFKNNWITIRNTKDKEDRITILVPSLQQDLKKLCEYDQSDKLFNVSITHIKHIFNQLNKMLNYKKHLNPYMLRHSFAHHCLQQGIDLKRVKEIMGHWDIKMTEEYLDLEPHEIISVAVKKFKFKKGGK